MSTAHQAGSDGEAPISYEQWGVDFFARAINQERVLGAVNAIAGQPIEFGPIGMGPGGLAKVRAYGEIAAASASRERGDQMSYRVLLPVDLNVEVDLQVDTQRFEAELLVPLTVTAVAHTGVRIRIEIDPPRSRDVQVDLRAQNARASVLQRLAGVEAEVRRIVVDYVRRELEEPRVRDLRVIDVSRAIEEVWTSLSPGMSGKDGSGIADGTPAPGMEHDGSTQLGDLEGR